MIVSDHLPSFYLKFTFPQNGIEFVAEHVLPLLLPLLIAQQLNVQQFAKYMAFVKEILRYITIYIHPPILIFSHHMSYIGVLGISDDKITYMN